MSCIFFLFTCLTLGCVVHPRGFEIFITPLSSCIPVFYKWSPPRFLLVGSCFPPSSESRCFSTLNVWVLVWHISALHPSMSFSARPSCLFVLFFPSPPPLDRPLLYPPFRGCGPSLFGVFRSQDGWLVDQKGVSHEFPYALSQPHPSSPPSHERVYVPLPFSVSFLTAAPSWSFHMGLRPWFISCDSAFLLLFFVEVYHRLTFFFPWLPSCLQLTLLYPDRFVGVSCPPNCGWVSFVCDSLCTFDLLCPCSWCTVAVCTCFTRSGDFHCNICYPLFCLCTVPRFFPLPSYLNFFLCDLRLWPGC